MAVRIATYGRISGAGGQLRRGKKRFVEGTSLELQAELTLRYAAEHDGVVAYELEDIGSGWRLTRKGYQKLLRVAREGRIDAVLVYKLDRFGRDNGEAISRCDELEREGVRIWSVIEGIDIPKFVRDIHFSVAAQESKSNRERALPMMRKMAELGLWPGRAPYGYRNDAERPGHLTVYEPEAEIVRELFARAAAGQSAYSLCGWLDSLRDGEGKPIMPPSWRNGKTHYSDHWSIGTITYILDNAVYAGRIVFDRRSNSVLVKRGKKGPEHLIERRGLHEPLVDEDVFDKVHALRTAKPHLFSRSSRRALAGPRFVLQGLVRCGVCGREMPGHLNHGQGRRKDGQPYVMYRCSHGGHACGVSGAKLNALVLEGLDGFVYPKNALEIVTEGRTKKKSVALDEQRADLVQQKAALKDQRRNALWDRSRGIMKPEEYRELMEMIDEREKLIERDLAALSANEPALLDLHVAAERMGQLRTFRPLVEYCMKSGKPEDVEFAHEQCRGLIQHIVVVRGQPPTIVWQGWAEELRAACAQLDPGEEYEIVPAPDLGPDRFAVSFCDQAQEG